MLAAPLVLKPGFATEHFLQSALAFDHLVCLEFHFSTALAKSTDDVWSLNFTKIFTGS